MVRSDLAPAMVIAHFVSRYSSVRVNRSLRFSIIRQLNTFDQENKMQWTAWATLAALLMYIWVSFNVGRGRAKYKIRAPIMDGPPEFLNIQRVHANTVEQIVGFLPALWMCAYFWDDRWAAVGGAIWTAGRVIYALSYYKDPSKRTLGFGIGLFASLALMAGTAFGLITR